jgi:hypothetical protein
MTYGACFCNMKPTASGYSRTLQDFGLAPAFLMGLDLRALCADDDAQIFYTFLDAMNEVNPAWMAFVRARGVGDHVEEDARAQIDTCRQGFDRNV